MYDFDHVYRFLYMFHVAWLDRSDDLSFHTRWGMDVYGKVV